MNQKIIRGIGASVVVCVWSALTLAAWFGPKQDMSTAERRKLANFPEVSAATVLNGKFTSEFETYTLDHFPMRDDFRELKALFHYNILGQKDNNGIYISDGYAAKMEYPMKSVSVNHALELFNRIYNTYLKENGSKAVVAVVPDKGYYLADQAGALSLDYETMFNMVRDGMPWAKFVDLRERLSLEDYYRTDTHWRQEHLIPVAAELCKALETEIPEEGEYTTKTVEKPFYGVYYGQAALPMNAETMFTLSSDLLDSCRVYNYETNATSGIYDWKKLDSYDLYDIYLSGAEPLLTIENPNASSDRELLVFRDSFGSSISPLLVQGYKTVTLVDIRYISSSMLNQFLDFHGQDALFLYSTLVLNSSSSLK